MSDIDSLLLLVEAYCRATGLAEATVSTRVLHDGKRLATIRAGGDIGVLRSREAIEWFSAHWPEGVSWPAKVTRPALATTEDR